ncbi:hypothetical protein C8F01DRAFT_1229180 [Mycena amicta]|nr:hypothetical protein C8F01DRAFT_1229180 [Mycena amicta]
MGPDYRSPIERIIHRIELAVDYWQEKSILSMTSESWTFRFANCGTPITQARIAALALSRWAQRLDQNTPGVSATTRFPKAPLTSVSVVIPREPERWKGSRNSSCGVAEVPPAKSSLRAAIRTWTQIRWIRLCQGVAPLLHPHYHSSRALSSPLSSPHHSELSPQWLPAKDHQRPDAGRNADGIIPRPNLKRHIRFKTVPMRLFKFTCVHWLRYRLC